MSEEAPAEVSPDLVFDLLSSARRRMVLYYLRQHGGQASVKELAKHIAALENDIRVEDVSQPQEKRVYVSLYQTHLPKLAEAGVIEYEKEQGIAGLTESALEMDDYLSQPATSTYPWQLHYLVLAVISVAILVLNSIGVPVFRAIPLVWMGIGISLAFAVSAGLHYLESRRRLSDIPPELQRVGK